MHSFGIGLEAFAKCLSSCPCAIATALLVRETVLLAFVVLLCHVNAEGGGVAKEVTLLR